MTLFRSFNDKMDSEEGKDKNKLNNYDGEIDVRQKISIFILCSIFWSKKSIFCKLVKYCEIMPNKFGFSLNLKLKTFLLEFKTSLTLMDFGELVSVILNLGFKQRYLD